MSKAKKRKREDRRASTAQHLDDILIEANERWGCERKTHRRHAFQIGRNAAGSVDKEDTPADEQKRRPVDTQKPCA